MCSGQYGILINLRFKLPCLAIVQKEKTHFFSVSKMAFSGLIEFYIQYTSCYKTKTLWL